MAGYQRYSSKEELLNVITHGAGILFSITALILMLVFAGKNGSVWQIVSASIYGSTMVILYLASTLFHAAKNPRVKHKLNIFDHASIYLLIAGTYTPFLLVTLRGPWGWSLFGVIWGLAIIGIILKLFFIYKYRVLSTIAYVLMGWAIIIAVKPLTEKLETEGLWLLLSGGFSYSIGAVLYLWKKLPYNHAIFHVFVLGGTVTHWAAVFGYVL